MAWRRRKYVVIIYVVTVEIYVTCSVPITLDNIMLSGARWVAQTIYDQRNKLHPYILLYARASQSNLAGRVR